jgi:hypothetical protein
LVKGFASKRRYHVSKNKKSIAISGGYLLILKMAFLLTGRQRTCILHLHHTTAMAAASRVYKKITLRQHTRPSHHRLPARRL